MARTRRLKPYQADRLRALELTYHEVGATLGELPPGYHHLDEQFVIGTGPQAFETAAAALLGWELQRRSGLAVSTSDAGVELGGVAVVRIGWGPLGVGAPVRVVALVEEEGRRGFAYGTLPGHPERGEELFTVELGPDEVVRLQVRAFSRPGTLLTRALGPAARAAQRWVTRRYGRALRPG